MGRDTAERKNRKPASKAAARRTKRAAKGKASAPSASEPAASRPDVPAMGAAPPGIAVGEVDAKAYLAKMMAESTVPPEERQRRRRILSEIQSRWRGIGISSEEYSRVKQAEIDHGE